MLRIKEKMTALASQAGATLRNHPAEVALSVAAFAVACYDYEDREERSWDAMLSYYPVVFLFTYTLNRLLKRGMGRWAYYLSPLLWIPFYLLPEQPLFTTTYAVSWLLIQLFYLSSGWERDNKRFLEGGFTYLRSLFFAGGFSVVTWLLTGSIYKSIFYIFDLGYGDGFARLMAYTGYGVFLVLFPFLFLLFNRRKETGWEGFGKLFGILLNYVLSPALLVYAAILYLYFIKITLTWSLPKGGVAAIAIGFIIAAFLLRGCQAFVERRMYDWFYRHASLWTLPALVMFWVATAYRVAQYGFTEPRVYLVVVGLILTATVLLFLTRRWGRYLYVACLTIGLFGVVTYIPGITAKDIERVSQKARGNYPERERTEETYIYISSDRPVDIQGYNTLVDIRNQTCPNDTLTVYDADTLVYREAYDVLLEKQLEKVGLSRSSDSIPESVYPDLLRIELDSSAILLESLNLKRDSLYHVSYMRGAYYLKR